MVKASLMKKRYEGIVNVLGSGAIILGSDVTCDGFHQERMVRAQTHIHSDHMRDFSTSKSRELVMSPAAFDLLKFDNPDFEFRSNIHQLNPGQVWSYGASKISLFPAGHMLGASQVVVELENGTRLGYSGDFFWPLDRSISCNALVIDATYGTPSSDRAYTQLEAEERLIELLGEQLRIGPVNLFANPAVIERALLAISFSDVAQDIPILGNDKLCFSCDVHRQHGWVLNQMVNINHEDGHNALRNGQYIRCGMLVGGQVDTMVEGTTISLTKYRANNVVEKISDRTYKVGMSNHADFDGTLSYIESTGAEFVVTDARRSKIDRARILANLVSQELGICAIPSSNEKSHKWSPINN